MKHFCACLLLCRLANLAADKIFAASENDFLGEWALHPPGGRAGWLGVVSSNHQLHADVMWIGGSVLPTESATVTDGKLVLTRFHEVTNKGEDGKISKMKLTETITAELSGDKLNCVSVTPKAGGAGEDRFEFSAKRLPPMPPAPNLSKIHFGSPTQLFNGTNLDGWRLVEADAANGWSARAGVLMNDPHPASGKHFGNLRTDAEFEDFSIHAETRVDAGQNSGIYLRGIYEVQVYDTFGKPRDSHNMGAVYSRITPSVSAEKPAGHWQTIDATLVQRHVTVILNGLKIIDNQPVFGPTGGALWSEVDRPGPIYLQGDHTGIEYRNMTLRPVADAN